MDRHYKELAKAFKIGNQKFFGMAIASPSTIYLIPTQVRNDVAAAVGGGLGGLLGGLIVGLLMARKKTTVVESSFQNCKVNELPPRLTEHPDWPFHAKKKDMDKTVYAISKKDVNELRYQKMSNLVHIMTNAVPVYFEYYMLNKKSIRAFFEETGWPVTSGKKPS